MMELAQLWVSELYTLHFFFNFSLITVISDLIIVMSCKNTHTQILHSVCEDHTWNIAYI